MADIKKTEPQQEPPVDEQPARPNRDAYAKMFAEDYPDVDFEDKEARYGKMTEDRKRYRELSESGRGLSTALNNNRWLGAMFQALSKNPDQDPITWMYENGIDVQQALEDDEYRQKVSEALSKFQENQVQGEKDEQEREANLEKSMQTLKSMQSQMGLSDEECNKMWSYLFEEVAAPAFMGNVSKEVWGIIRKGLNYDGDIKNAREEAGMQARNEKIQNNLKSFDEQNVPPSFSQGVEKVTTQKPKKKSGFFDDLKNYH